MVAQKYRLVVTAENNEGPISHHSFALYRELCRLGWQVILLVDEAKVAKPYETPEGLRVQNWPTSRATTWRDAYFLIKLLWRYRPLAIIGVFGSVNLSLLIGCLMRVPVRLAWYCTTLKTLQFNYPGSKWYFRFLKWRKRQVYRLSTGIISLTHGATVDFKKHFLSGKPTIRCFCLNPDPKQGRITNKIENKPYITFVGRLVPSKDPFTPIKALARLQTAYPELNLYIIGDGPLKKDLKQLAWSEGLAEKVIHLGALSHPEVYQWLAGSVANLCTSTTEAFGKVNTQALGLGVPIIATRVEGMRDIIREGYNGFGIEPMDAQVAAEQIQALLADHSYRQKLSRQARKDFEERFHLNNQVAFQAKELSDFLLHQG